MSNFLPESTRNSGTSSLGTADSSTSITEKDRRDIERIFSRPQLIPEKWWSYAVDLITISLPQIPIGLISGYAAQVWNYDDVDAEESTTSGSYTDLATTGPSISGLSDGVYLIAFGGKLKHDTAGRNANMSLSINGAAADDADSVSVESSGTARYVSVSGERKKTLQNNGNNTLVCKYDNGGSGTATFTRRWLRAQRIGNV